MRARGLEGVRKKVGQQKAGSCIERQVKRQEQVSGEQKAN